MHFFFLVFISLLITLIQSKVYNILDLGAIPSDKSDNTCISNTVIMNNTLSMLQPKDTLLIPSNNEFWFLGGIRAYNLAEITIKINGIISFTNKREIWPVTSNGHVLDCIYLYNITNFTLTSDNNDKGLIYGNGNRWWGAVDYLIHSENRPKLFHIQRSSQILINNIFFKDSPYWTCHVEDCKFVEIQYTNVSAKRTDIDYHDIYDMTAFNTDGFDVSGKEIYIHDCEIWNDDDCIAVKESDENSWASSCSENMKFERLNASGVGLTIGSIQPTLQHRCVNNITFNNIYMYHTFKGIYIKSDPPSSNNVNNINCYSNISNINYYNIIMDEPTQVPIWIGPQQAVYDGCCDILWPQVPDTKCPVPSQCYFRDIKLVNVTINNPRQSPGVVLGNVTNIMRNIVFENVVVNNPGDRPWGDLYYMCNGTQGYARGNTWPIPPCFINQTTS